MTSPRTDGAPTRTARLGRLALAAALAVGGGRASTASAATPASERAASTAAEHEARWAATQDPRELELAAQARADAGHHGHALAHWRTLLSQEPGPSAARRAELTRRMTASQRQTRPTLLRLRGERGPLTAVRVVVRRVGDERPAIELAAEDGRALDLDPGVWSLIAGAPGHVEVQRVWTVAPRLAREAAPTPEELTLVLPARERRVVLRLAAEGATEAPPGAGWVVVSEAGGEPQRAAGSSTHELSLGPGRWRARAEAPGFVAQEQVITVDRADLTLPVLTLRRAAAPAPAPTPPRAPPPKDLRVGLGLGLGLAGATSLGLGVGLLIQHREGYGRFMSAPGNDAFVAALTASDAGASLVGAGLGLGGAALTAGLAAPDRVLWAEVAVGGGVALIGSAWYARDWQRVQKDLYDGSKPDMNGATHSDDHDVKAQRRETAAASLIGAGGGLMIGAAAVLVTRTIVRLRGRSGSRAAHWSLAGGPGQLGLGLRGRF